MPTKRTWTFLIIALILYFLANQTQVGWVYVFVAAIIGLLGVAFLYDRGILKNIQAGRAFYSRAVDAAADEVYVSLSETAEIDPNLTPPAFHEDDPIEVILEFRRGGLRPALLLHGAESCPFAPPAEQKQSFFLPVLSRRRPVTLSYQTQCDRRGLHHFPALLLHSTGPFGFFKTARSLAVASNLLIYPSYHPLKRLRLLEQQEFAQRQTANVGLGTQVIGTREYRAGDSLRQIHWRSTARRNQLVVKEFSNEDQLTLTVVLDLAQNSSLGNGKTSTFETAVRLAASFGYYAGRKYLPFYLAGAGQKWSPPKTALSWWGTLNYLAKVQPNGHTPLSEVLTNLRTTSLVIVLISNPQVATIKALRSLGQKSRHTLALFITPDGNSPEPVKGLTASNLTVKHVTADTWIEHLESL